MDVQKMLADIDQGIGRTDLTVFRFRKGRAITNAILFTVIGLAVLGIAAALAPSMNPDASAVKYGVAVFVALVALSAFWRTWTKVAEIRHADSNLLVVSSDGVIRRLLGRVQSWSFAQYPDVTYVIHDRLAPKYAQQRSIRITLPPRKPEDSSQVEGIGHATSDESYGGIIGAVYLNETGADCQHELVDDGSFGPMRDILQTLIARGRSAASFP